MTLAGIDVSSFQSGTPPLAGLSFLFARATYGTAADTRYAMHIANARKAGLVTGAYHFGRGVESIGVQVAAFLAAAKDADLLALDLESDGANVGMTNAQAAQFIAAVQATGRTIGLYHSASAYPTSLGQDWRWIASWTASPPALAWQFWQYTDKPVDGDRFNGDQSALLLLAHPTSAGPVQGVDDVPITRIVAEDWTPDGVNGVFRDTPDRAAAVTGRVAAGTLVRTIAEVVTSAAAPNNDWRLTERAGKPAYMLRSDWLPVKQGGDPAVDAQLQAVIDRTVAPAINLVPLRNALAAASTNISAAQAALPK